MTSSYPRYGPDAAYLAGLLFLGVALALRCSTFGDTNLSSDDGFYFLVGRRMHQGLLPYVDVWDRKPLGLFLIYYLIAGVSTSVWAYQLAATGFAAATALIVFLIVRNLANLTGAIMAGVAYLVLLGPFDGQGGQSPIFYNLFIAGAAYLTLRQHDAMARGQAHWRNRAAMILCGLAITIKQTTLFESIFLGFWTLAMLRRAGCPWPLLARYALEFATIGSLPTLVIAATYWFLGHWGEFWHAMVLSNLSKGHVSRLAFYIRCLLFRIPPELIIGVIGIRSKTASATVRWFLTGWFMAAAIGFLAVPNFYGHYALPLMVPLTVACGLVFAHQDWGKLAFATVIIWAWQWYDPTDRASTQASIQSMKAMAAAVVQHDHGRGLLVYDGPPYLYAMTGRPFLSPLVFPHHLNHSIERNVSHLDTDRQIDRILAKRPGVVVMSLTPRNFPVNVYSYRQITSYVRRKCRLVTVITAFEQETRTPIGIYGDCRSGGMAQSR